MVLHLCFMFTSLLNKSNKVGMYIMHYVSFFELKYNLDNLAMFDNVPLSLKYGYGT